VKALVIGGAGFIGSHTVDRLIEKGFEVRSQYILKEFQNILIQKQS